MVDPYLIVLKRNPIQAYDKKGQDGVGAFVYQRTLTLPYAVGAYIFLASVSGP